MFTCPRCNQGLTRCQPKGGVYWRCPTCAGRTATLGMLHRTAAPDAVTMLWETARSAAAADGQHCPACHRTMKSASLPTAEPGRGAPLQLDVCLRCHLVWFDPAEYESMPPPQSGSHIAGHGLPLEARLAMAKLSVETLDTQPDLQFDSEPPVEGWKAVPAFFGMPVKTESRFFAEHSWGTWCLSGAVLVSTLLAWIYPEETFRAFGLIPREALRYGGLTLLSAFFLHGSLPHLATSVYFLMTFGDDVEDLLGTARFLLLLLGSVAAGNLLHVWIYPQAADPLLGAGAGISGLLISYGLRFPRARIGFILRVPVIIYRWVNLPAWLYILGWIALQAIGATQTAPGLTQVSWPAHLGGALAGLLFWLVMPGRKIADPPPQKPAA